MFHIVTENFGKEKISLISLPLSGGRTLLKDTSVLGSSLFCVISSLARTVQIIQNSSSILLGYPDIVFKITFHKFRSSLAEH